MADIDNDINDPAMQLVVEQSMTVGSGVRRIIVGSIEFKNSGTLVLEGPTLLIRSDAIMGRGAVTWGGAGKRSASALDRAAPGSPGTSKSAATTPGADGEAGGNGTDGVEGTHGVNGRDAPNLFLAYKKQRTAGSQSFGIIFIDLRGQSGQRGQDGGHGGVGGNGGGGGPGLSAPWNVGCMTPPGSGGNAGDGGDGGNGGDGGHAGNGGQLTILYQNSADEVEPVSVYKRLEPGDPGMGGRGGTGGSAGEPGLGGGGSGACLGQEFENAGSNGHKGDDGMGGSNGNMAEAGIYRIRQISKEEYDHLAQ